MPAGDDREPPLEPRSTIRHVRDAKAGAASPWPRLVKKIGEEVRRVCRSGTVPEGWDADDVVQIVSAEVFKTIDRFGGGDRDDFRAWVRSITRQRVIDLARRRAARGRPDAEASLQDLLDGAFDQPDAAAHTPSLFARAQEIETRAKAVVESLSERHRRVLELREEQGLDFGEIAGRIEGVESADAARFLYHYARKRRAAAMQSYAELHVEA